MSLPVKTVTILGVTGSIGQSAADVIASDPARFSVQSVTAYEDVEKLAAGARRLKARRAVIARAEKLPALRQALAGSSIEAAAGEEALIEAAGEKVDLTLAAIMGAAGLRPVMRAIEASKVVAIANKEPLVAAGDLVMAAARKHSTHILPVDSEHNAIFQVFDGARPETIRKIWLTASGGPFRTWSAAQMAQATVQQALKHPNWVMGKKITIDSATLMNKALEIIEAHYLFAMPAEKIEVVIHPQSVIHSMVEYCDGSVLAQMGASDMRTPVAYALAWPDRMDTPGARLDIKALADLSFEAPDFGRFPALRLAYEALAAGPYACAAFSAANEAAVAAFLNNRIGFSGIVECVAHVLERLSPQTLSTVDAVLDFDALVRQEAEAYINTGTTKRAAL